MPELDELGAAGSGVADSQAASGAIAAGSPLDQHLGAHAVVHPGSLLRNPLSPFVQHPPWHPLPSFRSSPAFSFPRFFKLFRFGFFIVCTSAKTRKTEESRYSRLSAYLLYFDALSLPRTLPSPPSPRRARALSLCGLRRRHATANCSRPFNCQVTKLLLVS